MIRKRQKTLKYKITFRYFIKITEDRYRSSNHYKKYENLIHIINHISLLCVWSYIFIYSEILNALNTNNGLINY